VNQFNSEHFPTEAFAYYLHENGQVVGDNIDLYCNIAAKFCKSYEHIDLSDWSTGQVDDFVFYLEKVGVPFPMLKQVHTICDMFVQYHHQTAQQPVSEVQQAIEPPVIETEDDDVGAQIAMMAAGVPDAFDSLQNEIGSQFEIKENDEQFINDQFLVDPPNSDDSDSDSEIEIGLAVNSPLETSREAATQVLSAPENLPLQHSADENYQLSTLSDPGPSMGEVSDTSSPADDFELSEAATKAADNIELEQVAPADVAAETDLFKNYKNVLQRQEKIDSEQIDRQIKIAQEFMQWLGGPDSKPSIQDMRRYLSHLSSGLDDSIDIREARKHLDQFVDYLGLDQASQDTGGKGSPKKKKKGPGLLSGLFGRKQTGPKEVKGAKVQESDEEN
jgi:hypothetical protein